MNRRRFFWALLVLFVCMNVVAYQHAYKFTHFTNEVSTRTKDPKDLDAFSKVKLLFTGIDNPKPKNKSLPSQNYQTIKIESTEVLECWQIKKPNARGTIIMFHGYAGEKSSLLERADEFLKLGYQIFLVDFMGSGGSEGDGTSVGFKEAEQVKDCFDYVSNEGEKNIILFGTSMGSAAILKAMDDYTLSVQSIIIECPFGSLYKTTKARFKLMHVPSFPMASMLCFWGGVQNGYWAFSHNPSEYAKSVTCPVLLLYGEQDNRVSKEETDLIFKNLKGHKALKKYPLAGHDVFRESNRSNWKQDVSQFLYTSPS